MECIHDLPMSSLRFFGLRAKFQSRVFTQFELEPLRVGARSACRSAPAIASACMMLSAISSGLNGLVILRRRARREWRRAVIARSWHGRSVLGRSRADDLQGSALECRK